MRDPLLLNQTALSAFETCPRRFQLRYLERLPWPASPLDRSQQQAVERGSHFHRLVERHFLGLAVDASVIHDDVVRDWWKRFANSNLAIPEGDRWPEHRLTTPVGDSFLNGRFDLLVLGEAHPPDGARSPSGGPFARLFDWKTSKPRPVGELATDWQTRLYLAMIAESAHVLAPYRQPITPDRISLTYWYTAEPDKPRVINYSAEEHRRNWKHIQDLVELIRSYDPAETWPLTDDRTLCRRCTYQAYCGRQDEGAGAGDPVEEETQSSANTAVLLEPQTP